MVYTPPTARSNSTYRHYMLSILFVAYWTTQAGNAAPLSSMESELPNASRLFLSGINRRRCPSLAATDAGVNINQNATGLLPIKRSRRSACRHVAQCDVMANPPEVEVSWYEVDADGNERLIHSKAQHDSTVDFLAEQEYPENQGEIFGMSETLNRICLDPYLLNPHHTYRFKCHAESVCHSQKADSEVFSVRRRGHSFNANQRVPRRRAPLINTITTTRIEYTGVLVQMFCHATGNPMPRIEWSIMDESNDNKLYPVTDKSFIRILDNNDLIIDTRDLGEDASLTFVCNASNALGQDSETSTLIAINK